MKLSLSDLRPIWVQIAEGISADILSGKLPEGEPVYSQLELARELSVNPATAAKALQHLVGQGVLVKVRGLNMAVAPGARTLLSKQQASPLQAPITHLVQLGRASGISDAQIIAAVKAALKENLS